MPGTLRRPSHLDELLNYRLMRLLTACLQPVNRLVEREYGITRREWRIVASLAAHGPTSPSRLADRVHLDRVRTSRVITSLTAKGWLRRQALPADRRHAVVELTDRGHDAYRALFPRIAAVNVQLLQALDDPQVDVLDACLDRLLARAESLNGTGEDAQGALPEPSRCGPPSTS